MLFCPEQWLRFRYVESAINDAPHGPLIDVGGRDGELAHFLPQGRRIIVADPDWPSLVKSRKTGLLAVQCRGEALPFKTGSAAVAVSCVALQYSHRDSRATFLEELKRISSHVVLVTPVGKGAEALCKLFLTIIKTVGHGDPYWYSEELKFGTPSMHVIRKAFPSGQYRGLNSFMGLFLLTIARWVPGGARIGPAFLVVFALWWLEWMGPHIAVGVSWRKDGC